MTSYGEEVEGGLSETGQQISVAVAHCHWCVSVCPCACTCYMHSYEVSIQLHPSSFLRLPSVSPTRNYTYTNPLKLHPNVNVLGQIYIFKAHVYQNSLYLDNLYNSGNVYTMLTLILSWYRIINDLHFLLSADLYLLRFLQATCNKKLGEKCF